MDRSQCRRATPLVILAVGVALTASAPVVVEADESLLKRMVGAVSPRRDGGPVARLHRRIEERPAHRNDYQDGLVVHAGGAYAGQLDSLEGHGGGNAAACRGGQCDDHCVVRPDRFGFYETQWRQWPGTRVVQAAGVEELTPASPPRLQLPEEAEESLDPKAAVEFGVDEPLEGPDATTLPGLGPIVPQPQPRLPAVKPAVPARPEPPALPPAMPESKVERDPVPPPENSNVREPEDADSRGAADDTAPRPSPKPAEPLQKPAAEEEAEPESKPDAKKPATPSTDDNLFDEAARRRRLQERLAVIRSEARASRVHPVPFPESETARPIADRAAEPTPAPAEAAEPAAPAGVKPVVYEHDEVQMEANPLRTSRDRGWRARLVD